MYPKNHVPVTVPRGTSGRLQPSVAALKMPSYVSTAVWLLKYAPSISYN